MSQSARKLESSMNRAPFLARNRSLAKSFRASTSTAFSPQALATLSPGGELQSAACKIKCLEASTPFGKTRIFDFDPVKRSNVNLGGFHANLGGPTDQADLAFRLAEMHGVRVGLFEAPGEKSSSWVWDVAKGRGPWARNVFDFYMTQVLTAKKAVCLAETTAAESVLVAELLRREEKDKGVTVTHQIFSNPFLPTVLNGPISSLGNGVKAWFRNRGLDDALVQGLRLEEGSLAAQKWDYTKAMQERWNKVGGLNVPTLWFAGKQSRLVPAAYQADTFAAYLQNLITREELRANTWFAAKDDAGEDLFRSHVDLVRQTIVDFLSTVAQRNA